MKSRSIFFASLLVAFPALLAALTFSEWRTAHFDAGELADSLVSGATADPDGDGVANLHEYVFFGEPLVVDTQLAPTLVEISGDLVLTYRERHDLSAVSVRLQGTTTLTQWITYNTVIEADRATFTGYDEVTLLDPVTFTEGRRFLRLRVELLPVVEPRAPTHLALGVVTPTTWGLSWTDPNTTETGYAVERQLSTDTWERLTTLGPDTGGWQHTAADYQTSMIYRVVAIGMGGIEANSDPVTLSDIDGDGIPNVFELGSTYTGQTGTYASDPAQFSSTGSGVSDGWLAANGFNPATHDVKTDTDEDGLTEAEEAARGTSPHSKNTDGDGLMDAEDAVGYEKFFTFTAAPEVRYVVVDLGPAQANGVWAINNQGTFVIGSAGQFVRFVGGVAQSAITGQLQSLNNEGSFLYNTTGAPHLIHRVDADGASSTHDYNSTIITRFGETHEEEGAYWNQRIVDATVKVSLQDDGSVWTSLNAEYWWLNDSPGDARSGYSRCELQNGAVIAGTAFFALFDWCSAEARTRHVDELWDDDAFFEWAMKTTTVGVTKAGDWVRYSSNQPYCTFGNDMAPGDINYWSFSDELRVDVELNGNGASPVDVTSIGTLPGQPGLWKSWTKNFDLGGNCLSLSGPDEGKALLTACNEETFTPTQIATNGLMISGNTLWRNGRVLPESELFADSSSWSDLRISHLTDNGAFLAGRVKRLLASNGEPLPVAEDRSALLVPAALQVDTNHDGTIAANETPPTSTKPFRHWINDDDDDPAEWVPPYPLQPPVPDYTNDVLDQAYDLSDFFPVFLDIKQLIMIFPPNDSVKYMLKQADGKMNFVFTSLTRDTAFGYQNDGVSDYGPSADTMVTEAPTHQITATGVDLFALAPDLVDRIKNDSQGVILVELRGMTAKPLKLVVEKPDGTQLAEVVVYIATGEIEWESLDTGNPVEDFKVPLSYATYTAKDLKWLEGRRYFSDGHGQSATSCRTSVNVKIKMAGAEGKTVTLQAFDVDEPIPDEWNSLPGSSVGIIDTNDANGPKGDDNGDSESTSGTFQTSGTKTTTTVLDGTGEATVVFITSSKHGSNFRIAAALANATAELDRLQVSTSGATHYVAPGVKPVRSFSGVTSPTLTIWRKLHLEFDTMRAPPTDASDSQANFVVGTINTYTPNYPAAGKSALSVGTSISIDKQNRFAYGRISISGLGDYKVTKSAYSPAVPNELIVELDSLPGPSVVGASFTLVDDDDFYLTDVGLPAPLPKYQDDEMVDALNSKFAPIYVEAVTVPVSENLIAFKLNEPSIHAFGSSLFVEKQDLYDTQYYWAHTICFAYQPATENDADPSDSGGLILGETPDVSPIGLDSYIGVSVIFMETTREHAIGENLSPVLLANSSVKANYQRSYRLDFLGTVAHELAHVPGKKTPTSDHDEGGLMADGGGLITNDFKPASLLRLRGIEKWGTE